MSISAPPNVGIHNAHTSMSTTSTTEDMYKMGGTELLL